MGLKWEKPSTCGRAEEKKKNSRIKFQKVINPFTGDTGSLLLSSLVQQHQEEEECSVKGG